MYKGFSGEQVGAEMMRFVSHRVLETRSERKNASTYYRANGGYMFWIFT